jgi:UDPglucose 6-dehydrogenase
MKICVYGLWHLGLVMLSALSEKSFDVVGLAENDDELKRLNAVKLPIYEDGIEALISQGLNAGNLNFSLDPNCLQDVDVVWVTFDTPVDDNDVADVEYVKQRIIDIFDHLQDGTVVLVSSQLPVGSIASLEEEFALRALDKSVCFACSPENLRLGQALNVFKTSERILVGVRNNETRQKLKPILSKFTDNVMWIGVEAAELSKHAINSWLAMSITFINELSRVAEKLGVDASEVEAAMRSENRIGHKAYIKPGGAFAGGTLARDLTFLSEVAERHNEKIPLLQSILPSNEMHRNWTLDRLENVVGELTGKTVAILGLTYKPGTDTLRRSPAIMLVNDLSGRGVSFKAFDPMVKVFEGDQPMIKLCTSFEDALDHADAALVMTEWPEFQSIQPEVITSQMNTPIVIDQNGFLNQLENHDNIKYLKIGKSL